MLNREAVSATASISRMQNENGGIGNNIFMQDGAHPQIYWPIKELLTAVFQYHIIYRHFVNSWPPLDLELDINPAGLFNKFGV